MGAVSAALARWAWRMLMRPFLFCFPAEFTHNWTMWLFSWLMAIPPCRWLVTAFFRVRDPRLQVHQFGFEFPNPVGLAAGLDKDATWCNALQALGFGFIEVGTLTAQAQPGNSKPRLYRLKADQALLNRMGFNNDGAADAARHLASRAPQTILGINIGKSKNVPNESAAADYLDSFERLYPFAAYFALNVSSPNTPGLRDLQTREALAGLLRVLTERNATLAHARKERLKPLLVKIAPDLDQGQLDDIVELCKEYRLAGIIVANTTTSRTGLKTPVSDLQAMGAGGISGRPLTERARALVAAVYRRTQGTLPIIGVGGIMTEEDAWQMIRAGASLIQVYTGLIYGGPGFVAAINRHLLRRLAECGKKSIEDVVGEASPISAEEKNQLNIGFPASLPGG
jgi:dihydroorotate dehydrogenase